MRLHLIFGEAVPQRRGQRVRIIGIDHDRKSVVPLRKRRAALFGAEVKVKRVPQTKTILISVACLRLEDRSIIPDRYSPSGSAQDVWVRTVIRLYVDLR